jgi:hypothetical protein
VRLVLTTIAFGMLCATTRDVRAVQSGHVTDADLRDAIEWASKGDVRPYQLLTAPAVDGRRSVRGRVYTRRVRLAKLAEFASKEGRTVQAEDVPHRVAEPTVMVAWDWEPRVVDSEAAGCSRFSEGPISVSVRVLADNSVPSHLQPTSVFTDRETVRQVISPFETNTDTIRFVAMFPVGVLRADTLLSWKTVLRCPDGPKTAETPALISAADLQRWR